MDEQKRNKHQSYGRFSTYVDDWIAVSQAAHYLDVKEYDLTEDDIKEYIKNMEQSQERYKAFKKDRLLLWRIIYISICSIFLISFLFLMPKIVVSIIIWLLFITIGLLLYPFYVLYEGLEVIFDNKYQHRFIKIDPHVEKMVDDYRWKQHVKPNGY